MSRNAKPVSSLPILEQTPLRRLTNQALFYLLTLTLVLPPSLVMPLAQAAYVDATSTSVPSAVDDSYDFAVADLDGANGLDVLVAVRGQSKLLINDGSGVFTDLTGDRMPGLADTTVAVAAGDVDGVNGPDLFLAGSSQNRLLINDGSGSFADETAGRLPADLSYSMDVVLRDIDGDSDLDAFVATRNGQNRLLINDGSGNFDDQTTSRLPVEIYASYAVVLDDFDGNGTPDAFVANFGQQNRFLRNNGLGVFSDDTAFALPPNIAGSNDAVSVDVDGDGDKDLAVADDAAGLRLLLNDGDGFFQVAPGGAVPVIGEYVTRVAAGDVDFDGSMDLVLGNAGQDRVLLNDGSGVFSDATAAQLPADDTRTFGVALVDGDSDLDLDFFAATPQGQDRYYENEIPFPRILVEVSPDYIEQGDPVTITVELFDEDGLDGSIVPNPAVEVIQPTAGTAAATAAGPGQWTFTPTEIGDHTVRVTATDTLSNVGVKEIGFLAQAADITDPTVSVSIDPATITQGQSADFSVTATDDRVIVSRSLTVGGVPVPLDINGNATYFPTATGSLPVVAQAEDAAGNVGTANSSIQVNPDSGAPVVTLTATPTPIDITNPIAISATATDNIAVTSFVVTVTGPAGGPADEPVPLDGSGNGSYTPFIPGAYTFTATAIDFAGNTTVETAVVDAQGIPDAEDPVVNLTVVPGTTIPGGTVTLTVNATDNIFVLSRALEINGTPVALDGANQAQFTAPILGDYTAVATATDPTGNVGTDTVVFSAVDPATDTDAPTVAITSPTDGDTISLLADITGTATDLTLVSYELAYRPAGDGPFIPFASGSSAVENGVLGTLDTTLLEAGLYDVRLTAEDINGLGSQVTRTYVVEEGANPGVLQLTFVDLNVPVAGLPLALLRSYDSRVKTSGDFGIGWSLDVQQGSIRNNRPVAEDWQRQSGGPFGVILCASATEDEFHLTDVKVSDRESYQFKAKVNLDNTLGISAGCPATLSFEYLSGDLPGATLQVIGSNAGILTGNYMTYDLGDPRFGFPYEPDGVRLTTIDGREFDYE